MELTAPYGHAGQYASLTRHVQHYRYPRLDFLSYRAHNEVSDNLLWGSKQPNGRGVLIPLDRNIKALRIRNVSSIVRFLKTLTDDASRDMSHLVPESVPSGLPVED